jgi:hypothetical protein
LYGDYSRVRLVRPNEAQPNPYSAVWAQQGRLLLDAELNEQTAIVLDYLRTLAVDFIGPFGGHIGRAGFRVVPDGDGFAFTPGHYYVHGLRCEAGPTVGLELPDPPFLIYVLVWEQTVGPIQDPTLADPALGPEAGNTTRRTQVAWRAHATPRLHGSARKLTGEEPVEQIVDAFARHNADPADRPLLRAAAASSGAPAQDPTTAPAAVRYRGFENQLYRVEIHSGGRVGEATFKWSRDNGSVELALDSLTGPDAQGELTAKLCRLWIDARSGLEPGDWVELADDGWAPSGNPPALLEVKSVRQSTREVVLAGGTGEYEFDADSHPYLRRWDQSPAVRASDNAIDLSEVPDGADEWTELEDGVRVQFIAAGGEYQRGDYWLIPARTTTGGVLWPSSVDGPLAVTPAGPARYRAPLALVRQADDEGDLEITDLRTLFTHLAWPGMELSGGE